jgi:hypothetical protein
MGFVFINKSALKKRLFYGSDKTIFLHEKGLLTLIFNFSKLNFRCYFVIYYIFFFIKKEYKKPRLYSKTLKLIKMIIQNITEFSYFFSQKKLLFNQVKFLIKNINNVNGMSRSPVYRLCFGYRIS